MDTLALFVLLAIGGVNFGWQPAEDGAAGYEYIVQVEPELVAALERGESVPIESNIPFEVAPIRKVRLVVGRQDLPRTAVRHTSNFAGQAGWTPDRYATSPTAGSGNADRYGAAASVVQPPPSILDRTETAISETGSALSNGVQAAGEQMSRAGAQAWDDTRNAAQGFGQQIQQWGNDAGRQLDSASNNFQRPADQSLDAAGNQLRQAGNSLGLTGNNSAASSGGVTAPPWPSSSAATAPAWSSDGAAAHITPIDSTAAAGMNMTRTNTGWTSIGSGVAAPPLLNPPIATTAGNAHARVAASGPSGPSFPALPNATLPAPPTSREPLHSVLVDPSRQPPASGVAANQWGNSWGTGDQTAHATIGRDAAESDNSQRSSGLVPIRPVTPTIQDNREAANRWADPWAESDPWKQAPQNNSPQGSPQQPQSAFANSGPGTNAPSVQSVVGQAPPSNTHTAGFGVNPNLPGANASNAPISGTNLPGGLPPANQPPWLPLLLVSLSLVGSLSANLFLGWSYMDARHKYRNLVRKTADTFRRVTSAAA